MSTPPPLLTGIGVACKKCGARFNIGTTIINFDVWKAAFKPAKGVCSFCLAEDEYTSSDLFPIPSLSPEN
jgi:hypothetical protein